MVLFKKKNLSLFDCDFFFLAIKLHCSCAGNILMQCNVFIRNMKNTPPKNWPQKCKVSITACTVC